MILNLISDYKANVPLQMLEAKYRVPIHVIISVLHRVMVQRPAEIKECKKILKEID